MAKNLNVGDRVRYSMEYLVQAKMTDTKYAHARGVIVNKIDMENGNDIACVDWEMRSHKKLLRTHEFVSSLIKTEVPVKR